MTPDQFPSHPVQFTVDYPDRPLNRLTTFFRLIVIIPIAIVLGLLAGGEAAFGTQLEASTYSASFGGLLVLPPLLMVLFRQKYPRWWLDWNVNLLKFQYRVGVYFSLLRDEYPSTDEDQAVHIDVPYPDMPHELNRWLPLVKWLLVIPHYIVLFFLGIGAFVAVIIAWFAILFTGRYPHGLFNYIVGVMRWSARVMAYAFLLTTDWYPPFTLAE
ncbi:MAG: DUF4389 domain-containing protein [Dehalococcoidia bacterium]